MKTGKILALISFLSAIIFIISGTIGGIESFHYKNELDGIIIKSPVLLPFILAIFLGIIALIIIIIKKEINPFFILLVLLGIIIPVGIPFFFPTYARSIYAMKMAPLNEISQRMEFCYYDLGNYPEIKVQNGYVDNKNICGYPIPENPIKHERILNKMFIKTTSFKGISNTDNRDKYCIYTRIFEDRQEFLAISQQGLKELKKEPTSLDDCY